MKLIDLNPCWVGAGGEGVTHNGQPVPERRGVGLGFDCPCGCDQPAYVPFRNPLDGGPMLQDDPPHPSWQRTGDTFETLTLSPSIYRSHPGSCGWHGFIRSGNIETV